MASYLKVRSYEKPESKWQCGDHAHHSEYIKETLNRATVINHHMREFNIVLSEARRHGIVKWQSPKLTELVMWLEMTSLLFLRQPFVYRQRRQSRHPPSPVCRHGRHVVSPPLPIDKHVTYADDLLIRAKMLKHLMGQFGDLLQDPCFHQSIKRQNRDEELADTLIDLVESIAYMAKYFRDVMFSNFFAGLIPKTKR